MTVDDVIDVIRDEATEDILKLAGTTAEEIHFPGVLRGAWIRFPWLGASFIGGFLGIYLLARFEGLLSQTLQIAFFLPIVLAMGGNTGSQCSMVVTRGVRNIGRKLRAKHVFIRKDHGRPNTKPRSTRRSAAVRAAIVAEYYCSPRSPPR